MKDRHARSAARRRSSRHVAQFGVVFCGGGPSTLGPFVCAARAGRLDEFLARGVLVIERTAHLGGGSMRHYRISSNSLSGAFVEGLDAIPAGGPFEDLRGRATTARLRRRGNDHVPLKAVGQYLDTLGAEIESILQRHPACAVARHMTVRQVNLHAAGAEIAATGPDRRGHVVGARQVVIAMGGRAADHFERLEVAAGVTLAAYGKKVRHASALFDDRIRLSPTLLTAVKMSGRVAIVGGSHSAWSAAWLLLKDERFKTSRGTPPTVTLIHRSPVRLFYLTKEEAVADGYVFDPILDVCPLSGRVNRVSGLKGDARELARQVLLGQGDLPMRLLRVEREGDGREAASALDEAGLIVVATGYQARLPKLVDETERPIEPAWSSAGLEVTEGAQVVEAHGRVLSRVFAYGLGVGIRPSPRIGGEPSYARAITSVWLYQHDVGQLILDSLLGSEGGQPRGEAGPLSAGCLATGF